MYSRTGFDAHIGSEFSRTKKRGFGTYVKNVLKEFSKYAPPTFKIRTNEKEFVTKAFTLTIANAGQYGNNAYISPLSNITDGSLELCIIKPFPLFKAIDLGTRLFLKNIHKSKFLHIYNFKEVSIESDDAVCYHVDGEIFEFAGKLEVRVIPACLKVLVE